MGDRIRLGEQLAGVGTVLLLILLPIGTWFQVGSPNPDRGLPGGVYVAGAAGSTHLGWFAFGVTCVATLASIVYFVRVFTARTSERVMLQAPVAFVVGAFATIVVAVRLVLFTPGFDLTFPITGVERTSTVHFDASITQGGWLGLLALFLIPLGTWIAMADERLGSDGAYERTAALLADAPVRPVPLTGAASATADSEAAVVADDAAGDESEAPARDVE